jgi:multicomponent Na+:H+ antiporter subunit E
MNIIDHESYPFDLTVRLLRYFLYLGKEILISNVDVIKRILTLGPVDISPQVMTLPAVKKTDLSQMIYANSITLTPGTVTLELSNDKIIVHALSKKGAADLKTGEMARAVPDNVELSS